MKLYKEIAVANWKHQHRQPEIKEEKEKEKEKGKIAINSDKTVYHKILKRWLMESIIPFNQMEHMFPDQCLPGTILKVKVRLPEYENTSHSTIKLQFLFMILFKQL